MHFSNKIYFLLFLCAGCYSSEHTEKEANIRLEISPPEPDKDLREKYEANLKTENGCSFSNPDTSVYKIELLDQASSSRVVGNDYKLVENNVDMPHVSFNSSDNKQILTLFFHYGGARNSFSEFQVQINNGLQKNRPVNTQIFATNNNIKLGLTKESLIQILGSCYTASLINDKEVLKYIIDDSMSSFLKLYNYPSYYGHYEFKAGRLVKFRFGFEYP
ncbi:MAG: hypothetical protein JWP69_1273 [Flaviaesturariibacter sp.]|nr:hypothetical protein [Flaviaesturariibacter sp.]